ncbi:MAG: cob(I)yrinic acid a,c-diamide adenosyltransferase [Flavobacteriales bacterium]
MKIYTKGGDKGSTSLFSGKRVPKSALRIEAYGTLDELNSFTGLLHAQLSQDFIKKDLLQIQSHLFAMGSWLASELPDKTKLPVLDETEVTFLEHSIDKMEEELEPMRNFILPGGNVQVSSAHVCRTVCRRAERNCVKLASEENIPAHVIIYLNRLSDYFFVLARYLGKLTGSTEIPWKPKL